VLYDRNAQNPKPAVAEISEMRKRRRELVPLTCSSRMAPSNKCFDLPDVRLRLRVQLIVSFGTFKNSSNCYKCGRNKNLIAGGHRVDREYEIFEKFPDGSHIWRAFVKGLIDARARVEQLSQTSPNEFYAIHTPTQEIVANSAKFRQSN